MKIRISLLWLFKIIADLISGIVALMEPGLIDMIREGELYGEALSPEMLFFITVILMIPLTMAFLTLILKDKANRWTNIIVGIVFVAFGILNFADPAMHTAHGILISVAMFLAPVLVVLYAWKWE